MFGFKFLGNTHVPHRKNTAKMPGVRMTPPNEVDEVISAKYDAFNAKDIQKTKVKYVSLFIINTSQ